MGRSERIQERLKNIPVEVPGTWYHEDIPWLLAENARLEAERDVAIAALRMYSGCYECKNGPEARYDRYPCHGCDCQETEWQWRGAQPATGAEERSGDDEL